MEAMYYTVTMKLLLTSPQTRKSLSLYSFSALFQVLKAAIENNWIFMFVCLKCSCTYNGHDVAKSFTICGGGREGNSCAKDHISQLIPEMKKLFWDWKFNENYFKKPHKGIQEDCLTFLSGSKCGHTDTIRYPGITLKTTWSVESPLMRLQ